MLINATIVHALTLLHPAVPQPDGGQLWPLVVDWERVVDAMVHIARHQGCDAMPLGLPQLTAVLVGGGPATVYELYHPDCSPRPVRSSGNSTWTS